MAGDSRILIVEARFYPDIADELAAGAAAAIEAAGVTSERVAVPGAFEIPAAIALAAGLSGTAPGAPRFDAYVALGCVIRGETSHFDIVCAETARGIQDLAVHRGLAIGFGVLTCDNREQALARAARNKGNKGGEAVEACLRMLALHRMFRSAGAEPDRESDA